MVRPAGEDRELPGRRVSDGRHPGGTALLDAQLFLTEEWIADQAPQEEARPRKVKFQSKPQIAAEMIRRALATGQVPSTGSPPTSCTGSDILDALEAMNLRYVVEVKKNTVVWTVDPATLPGTFPGPKLRRKSGSYWQDASLHLNGQKNHLFHNNRNGTFTDVTGGTQVAGETQSRFLLHFHPAKATDLCGRSDGP